MKKSIKSLQKGLDILCSFDFGNEALSAQAISQRLEIPVSTTYRYLEVLEERGFLIKDPDSKDYKLGYMIFQMGNTVDAQMRLINIVTPHMKSLFSLSRETVLLTVMSGWKALCIESIVTDRPLKLSLERGVSLPLYAGAPSKILLAYQKDSFVDSFFQKVPLSRFTGNTVVDPAMIRKDLKGIRDQGFAFTDQEVDLGASAISAPIFDSKGNMVAGLGVTGPAERITGENKPRLIELVKDAASRASYDLAHGKTTSPQA